ncbi:MAG: hypothetical protein V7739_03910 [Motiliproteus sp.]
MWNRFAFALTLLSLSNSLFAAEVESMTSCAKEGEGWRCAEWSSGQMKVFESKTLQSKLQFTSDEAPSAESQKQPIIDPDLAKGKSETPLQESVEKQPLTTAKSPRTAPKKSSQAATSDGRKYTLQLLACQSITCLKQIDNLGHIPDSRITDIQIQGTLWRVLLVGEFLTRQSALSAKKKLKAQYQLNEEPWIRTLHYI